MANHRFINEEKFFSQTKTTTHYKTSIKIRSVVNNFLKFVTMHHLSSMQEYIKYISDKQYSCVIEIEDESNNIFHCGIKYNELENKKLEIISTYFKQIYRQD